MLEYMSRNKAVYFKEYSYTKRNTILFGTLKTNSELHKLFSYKDKKTTRGRSGGDRVGDEVVFDLMYYDFLGFLKYYKKNPIPPPPLRHTIFTVSTTSDSSYQDITDRYRTLSINLEGYSVGDEGLDSGIISSSSKGYQYMKTMNNRHPFRYHQIDPRKYKELHALLYTPTLKKNTDSRKLEYYAVPVESSSAPLLDMVLYQIYKKKSNVENRQLFLTRLEQMRDRLNEVLPTIHGGYIPNTFSSPNRALADVFLDKMSRRPEEVSGEFLWSLLSVPELITPGITYDLFYLKQTEQNEKSDAALECLMNPFYHPDTYEESESHTALIILEIEQNNLLFTIRKGEVERNPFELGKKTKSMLYKWLRYGRTSNRTGVYKRLHSSVYPKVQTYAEYLSLFPPKYYTYTVKAIHRKLGRDITKVLDSNQMVIYILVHLKNSNMIIPVIPHFCYDPAWKKKPYHPIMRPKFEKALGYLSTMATDQLGFPMYTPE